MKERTKRFALDVLDLVKLLPRDEPGPTIRRQLGKAAQSVHINYRATCCARTHTEFTARMGVVAEEADESQGWLDVIAAAKLISTPALPKLQREATELVAIFSKSVGTARMKERSRRHGA